MLRSRVQREKIKKFLGAHIIQIASGCAEVFHPTPVQTKPVPFPTNLTKDTLLFDKWPIGRGIFTTLTTGMKIHNPDLMSALHRPVSELFFYVTQRVFTYAQEAIRSAKPDIVYIFNGRLATTAACIWACEEANIKWVIHERGATKDKFALFPDYPQKVDVWAEWIHEYCKGVDEDTLKLFAASYFSDRRRGAPRDYFSFTSHHKKGVLPPHLENKKYVVYYVSSEDELSGLGSHQNLNLGWGTQREAFQTLKRHCQQVGLHLVVRVHPHLMAKSAEESEYWQNQSGEGIEVLAAKSKVCSYSLMDGAHVVATFMSSMGIEALYWGKPCLLLGCAYYNEMNGPFLPSTTDELREYLMAPTCPEDLTDVWKWGYFHETYGQDYRYYQADKLFEGRFLGRDLWKEINEEAQQRFLKEQRPSSTNR